MSKRRTHSPEFKARVAMEAISARKTIQEIAADHTIHPHPGEPVEEAAALMPVNCESWLIQTTLSSASAANVHCWAYPDRRMTTGFQQTLTRRD